MCACCESLQKSQTAHEQIAQASRHQNRDDPTRHGRLVNEHTAGAKPKHLKFHFDYIKVVPQNALSGTLVVPELRIDPF